MYRPLVLLKHIALFLATLLTTMAAGMVWRNELDFANIGVGLPYALSLLFILSCHEFGHFFAARAHGVPVTLPYYIPIPPIAGMVNFGTLGAVIRTRAAIPSQKALFDIGIAGPIAGFVASLLVLAWGFMHLPGTDFLLAIHPDYDFSAQTLQQGEPAGTLAFGSTLLYNWFQHLFAPAGAFVPPMTEMYHYPFLVTGWFGLLVTALNLLPAGQLDGGHIAYAMYGVRHRMIARITLGVLLVAGGLGMLPSVLDLAGFGSTAIMLLESIPGYFSYFWPGWLFWGLILLFVVKVDHPPVETTEPLDSRRMLLGWGAWAMLLICISPAPLYFL